MKIFFRVGGSIKNIEQNTNFERISIFGTKCQKISTDISKIQNYLAIQYWKNTKNVKYQ
jgi:hypothetical protein